MSLTVHTHISVCVTYVIKTYFTEFFIKTQGINENLTKETSVSSQDATAAPYAFQDDPFLIPTSSVESVSVFM